VVFGERYDGQLGCTVPHLIGNAIKKWGQERNRQGEKVTLKGLGGTEGRPSGIKGNYQQGKGYFGGG